MHVNTEITTTHIVTTSPAHRAHFKVHFQVYILCNEMTSKKLKCILF